MDQRPQDKIVSAEQSAKRIDAAQSILLSLLLALPLIGLMIGLVVAIRIVIFVIARSKRMVADLALAAGAISLGFVGMIAEIVLMSSGHFALAIFALTALNYVILTAILNKRLGHIFSRPGIQTAH